MDAIRNLDELIAWTSGGKPVDYLFFWGHRPRKDGTVDATCMSQWYAQSFTHEGIFYATAEHFMMAGKARLFSDAAALAQILASKDPAKVKALGRAIKGYDEARWVEQRFAIVVAGNHAKFSQTAALKEFLLATGSKILVEASPMDRIWGIGLAADDPRASHPEQWDGLNLLGFALMAVRDMLRTS